MSNEAIGTTRIFVKDNTAKMIAKKHEVKKLLKTITCKKVNCLKGITQRQLLIPKDKILKESRKKPTKNI